jgi:cytochrome c oxidase subunit 2
MFWVCLAVFAVVMAFVLAAVFRRRGLSLAAPVVVMQDAAVERGLTRSVAAGVAMTVAILFVFLFASVFTGRSVAALSASEPLTLEIVGRQWWWEIVYTNAEPYKIVRTANELHIPVGTPVLLKLLSHDVVHSFWVPSLHGKRDLIPGKETELWIQADRPGTYEGQCAEFCGHQHAHMRFLVVADTPDAFNAWLEAQRLPAAPPAAAEAEHGRQVFMKSSCILCHTIHGTQAAASNGPDLTHVGSRMSLGAGAIPNTRGHLAGWVVDSQTIKPGNHMPMNNLTSEDLQGLIAYLESLQ